MLLTNRLISHPSGYDIMYNALGRGSDLVEYNFENIYLMLYNPFTTSLPETNQY